MNNPAQIDPKNVDTVDEQERLGLKPRAEKLYSASVVEKNKLDVKTIKNITGTILILSDLRTEIDPEGVVLQPNQIMDLTSFFEPKEINRSRRLAEAIKCNAVAVVERCSTAGDVKDIPDTLPTALVDKDGNAVDTTPDMVNKTMPRNVYDDKYHKLELQEELRNKNQSQEAKR